TPQGRHATALQPINNWYQQTWHTIEFSNNRSKRILQQNNFILEFALFFLRCDVSTLFHSFSFCQIRVSASFTSEKAWSQRKTAADLPAHWTHD
ncbi:hypothetical protein ACWF5H_14925, partial [Arthrobacter sp. NPDC055138]